MSGSGRPRRSGPGPASARCSTGSTPSRSSTATTACSVAAPGRPAPRSCGPASATGTTRSAGRSSVVSGWPGRSRGSPSTSRTPDVPSPRLAGPPTQPGLAGPRAAVVPAGAVLRPPSAALRHGQRRRLGGRVLRARPRGAGALALGPPAVGRRLVRVAGPGDLLGLRAGRRPLRDRRHADRGERHRPVHRRPLAALAQRPGEPRGAAAGAGGGVHRRQRPAGRDGLRPVPGGAGPDRSRGRRPRPRRAAEPAGDRRHPAAGHHVGRHALGPDDRGRHRAGQQTVGRRPGVDRRARPAPGRGNAGRRLAPPSGGLTVQLTYHLGPDDAAAALRADALGGLTATPKSLPPWWFYDERGSELFDRITRLPDYYPTRTERTILQARAGDIAAAAGADVLVELGSGTSEKTRLLLTALREAGTLRRFVPFDVDPSVLRLAGSALVEEYPGLEVDGVVGDFTRHLGELPREGRRLVAFLGSTIGNLTPGERAAFLAE